MKKLHVPPHITTTVFEGSSIILDSRKNIYYALNDTAATFWNFLVELGSLESAIAETSKIYNAPPDAIEHDMNNLLNSLILAGFIETNEKKV